MTVVIGRRPMLTLARLAVLIIGTWAVFTFVLTPPIRVSGISMQPTFHEGQINFLNRVAYLRHDPRRGDVVGIRAKGTEGISMLYLKRIVGLPGETVAFENGTLFINDVPQQEPYVNKGDVIGTIRRSSWDSMNIMSPVTIAPCSSSFTGTRRCGGSRLWGGFYMEAVREE